MISVGADCTETGLTVPDTHDGISQSHGKDFISEFE